MQFFFIIDQDGQYLSSISASFFFQIHLKRVDNGNSPCPFRIAAYKKNNVSVYPFQIIFCN